MFINYAPVDFVARYGTSERAVHGLTPATRMPPIINLSLQCASNFISSCAVPTGSQTTPHDTPSSKTLTAHRHA